MNFATLCTLRETKIFVSYKITISVISDLVNDQRIHKVATTLHNNGYKVNVIGAKRNSSFPLQKQPYNSKRISLLFQKGFLMYAEWNIKLFITLFFQKTDVFVANDLDTLLPNFLQSKIRNKKLVYDSHEYFTEQEELVNRKGVQSVWLKLEKFIFPKLKNVCTVNESIANVYYKLYKVNVAVIKNLPLQINEELPSTANVELFNKTFKDKKILLTQGTGFNANRGIEELIEAMQFLNNDYVLVIIGKGLQINNLKTKASNSIFFIDTVTATQLKWMTKKAYVGFTLDKATCLNYEYSLPNKLFDFVQANVPIIASDRVEVAKIIKENNIGIVLEDVTPLAIAQAIISIQKEQYQKYKYNLRITAAKYTWQRQENTLLDIYKNLA